MMMAKIYLGGVIATTAALVISIPIDGVRKARRDATDGELVYEIVVGVGVALMLIDWAIIWPLRIRKNFVVIMRCFT